MSLNPTTDYLEFLRFASISTDSQYRPQLLACADWLVQKLQKIGLEAKQYPTPGHPVVVARNSFQPGRKTVLIYGHYDVQPVDPVGLWSHPPFEPHVENGVVTARGSSDNKGQIFAHICGVAEALASGKDLPVNLIFLIEGEEEISSPNLASFLKEHASELACDIVIISDSAMIAPGTPTLTYGLRGLLGMEVHVTGPSQDLHSGMYGGAVVNPATVLARMITSLHDAQGRVVIPGFYDSVKPMTDWERKAWAELPFGEKELLKITGAPALGGEAGYSALECIWARPTAEVNGIYSGYQGEGTKTVLPKEAHAKLTFRLVPDQDPQAIAELVKKYLLAQAPPTVRVEITGGRGGAPYATDPHSAFGVAAQRALQKTFGDTKLALVREGGSIPIVSDFRTILGAETLLLGLALPDCNAHAPNETFPLEHLHIGARLNRALLEEIART